MGRAGSIAVLLPATAYSLKTLRQGQGDDRLGCSCRTCNRLATPDPASVESVPFIFGLGRDEQNMTIEVALVASTLNAHTR